MIKVRNFSSFITSNLLLLFLTHVEGFIATTKSTVFDSSDSLTQVALSPVIPITSLISQTETIINPQPTIVSHENSSTEVTSPISFITELIHINFLLNSSTSDNISIHDSLPELQSPTYSGKNLEILIPIEKSSSVRSIPEVRHNLITTSVPSAKSKNYVFYDVIARNETFYENGFEIDNSFSPNNYNVFLYTNSTNILQEKNRSFSLFLAKVIVMVIIIVVAVLGNSLVIVSIYLHRRLHCPANYLLVSLASADLLVALCAMTFNLSVELLNGVWIFGNIMCDLWNSFDVYFSTVSILHLCSISVDRYYAIVRPLEYPLTMTNNMLTYMLCQAWIAPVLISFLPIFLGWYTTKENLNQRLLDPYTCKFKVNPIFAVMSSSVSFWLPCTVMSIMYFRIFQEARKQERAMLTRASSSASSAAARLNGSQADPRQQLLAALQGVPLAATPIHQAYIMKSLNGDNSSRSSSMISGKNHADVSGGSCSQIVCDQVRQPSPPQSSPPPPLPQILWPGMVSPPKRNTCNSSTGAVCAPPGKREHKAARTLGLIMGAFMMCWLPFFTWYVSTNLCGDGCSCPPGVVTTVFWIGYFNSTLNPFIYAYVRADFRHAFRSTLTRCCRPRYPTGDFV